MTDSTFMYCRPYKKHTLLISSPMEIKFYAEMKLSMVVNEELL